MLAGVDKIYHILVCALITVLAFLALVIAYNCFNSKNNKSYVDDDNEHHVESINDDDGDVELAAVPPAEDSSDSNMYKCTRFIVQLPRRNYIIIMMAILSGAMAMAIGILKEVFDAYNIINGQASWGDILADFIGVIIGACIIVLYVNFCKKRGVG